MSRPIKIAKGGFADIWDLQNGTVLKAYRSEPRAHGHITNFLDHDLLTSVFCAQEVKAYFKLRKIESVIDYIPKIYQHCDPISILASSHSSYVKGAGIIIEKIEGKDKKIAHLSLEERKVVEPVLVAVSEVLNNLNVWDSSCFYESDCSFKLIDFALWDSSEYECQLYGFGRLTNGQKYVLNGLLETNNDW